MEMEVKMVWVEEEGMEIEAEEAKGIHRMVGSKGERTWKS